MSTLSLILVCVGVLTANVGALNRKEWDGIQKSVGPIGLECAKENDVNEEEFLAAMKTLSTKALTPCFLTCILQKTGFMGSNGLFDLGTLKEASKTYFKSEEDLKKFEDIAKICVWAVNDVNGSYGNKDCERAKLFTECFLKNKGELIPVTA